jgi:hypothetical protein
MGRKDTVTIDQMRGLTRWATIGLIFLFVASVAIGLNLFVQWPQHRLYVSAVFCAAMLAWMRAFDAIQRRARAERQWSEPPAQRPESSS